MGNKNSAPASKEVLSGTQLQAELIIHESVARAAEVLVDIMDNCGSDTLRLQAAKAIISLSKGDKSPKDVIPDWDDYRNNATKD